MARKTKNQQGSTLLEMGKFPQSKTGKRLLTGFTLIEITVVLAIMAVLLVTAGLSIFYTQRNRLLLEQAAQDLASEIRLVQSRILAIQKIEVNGTSFVPKAAVIRIENQQEPNEQEPIISYLRPNPDCSSANIIQDKTFRLEGRGRISSITPQSPIYLIYTSPIGRFYTTSSFPTFSNSANNSCVPSSYSNEDVTVELTNDVQTYRLEIERQTGEVTIREKKI